MWRRTEDIELRPWRRGRTGKALVFADGVVVACEDDARGEPHHEEIQRGSGRDEKVVASLGIAYDGSVTAYSCRCQRGWLAERLVEHNPALILMESDLGEVGHHG